MSDRSGDRASVLSRASLSPDVVMARKETKSLAHKRIKRQSQDWTTLPSHGVRELSLIGCQRAIAAHVQQLYRSNSISAPAGRGPPHFV